MRVKGSVEYNGVTTEITEKNLTQIYFQHDGNTTQIMITLLIGDEEITLDKTSIYELKLVQISDPINKELDLVDEWIESVNSWNKSRSKNNHKDF